MEAIVAYVPVLHEGYRQLLERHKQADLFILGDDLIGQFTYLSKEIRALDPVLIKSAIESWNIVPRVEVIMEEGFKNLQSKYSSLIMPDEDIMHELADKYFTDHRITFDKIFLRWDKHKTMEENPVQADQKISEEEFDREVMGILEKEADKSSDWWRRVGAAIIKDGQIIFQAHNEHQPSPHSPWAEGDPRNTLHKGVGIEYSSSIHAEARLIAEAARAGISLEGVSMYVTVFPCPPCAKQIAFAGIKKLYYAGGYSLLDQERILRSRNVEIIYVDHKK